MKSAPCFSMTIRLGIALIAAALLLITPASNIWGDSGKRDPLSYRIVSFHRGRADKDLIRRSAELGFNGVMFQLEGGNVGPLKDFAERNERERYIQLCHSLGMEVTLWVHELSDIPGEDDPNYLGPIELDNAKLWNHLADRYEWVLGELVPDIDGLVLTVVETQIWLTDSEQMAKLVGILQDKCNKYGKKLIVRTFVHHMDQFEGVMGCVKQLPDDAIIMSKCVPQDWQMRGVNNPAIGAVGKREQIVEYDVAGEYFLKNVTANCMPELLKKQFDYDLTKGVDGICVRVDRDLDNVLQHPDEVNLWALGMFASGKTDSVDEVWNAWAMERYGEKAAPYVIEALKPTQFVVSELLDIGTHSYGDTRGFPRGIKSDAFSTNWANYRWDPAYMDEYRRYLNGDPQMILEVERAKTEALHEAQQCLSALDEAQPYLTEEDYRILRTKLRNNQVQLEFRAPIMLANLRYKRLLKTDNEREKRQLVDQIKNDLRTIRIVAKRQYGPVEEIDYRGKRWSVGAPERFVPALIIQWTDDAEQVLRDQGLWDE